MADFFENLLSTKLKWECISLGAAINSRMQKAFAKQSKNQQCWFWLCFKAQRDLQQQWGRAQTCQNTLQAASQTIPWCFFRWGLCVLTQSYPFSQANLIMEVLGVGIFVTVSPCQSWQDTVGVFSDALLTLCWVPASESGKRRMQAGDSSTLPHIQAQPLPGFSL